MEPPPEVTAGNVTVPLIVALAGSGAVVPDAAGARVAVTTGASVAADVGVLAGVGVLPGRNAPEFPPPHAASSAAKAATPKKE